MHIPFFCCNFAAKFEKKSKKMNAIVQFLVSNFRSIREQKMLIMQSAAIKDIAAFTMLRNGDKLLPVAAIYGANSSGKTNVIRALQLMDRMIMQSIRLNDGEELPYDPYLFNIKSRKSPTLFEMTFIVDGHKYRYGFEYTRDKIIGEWLYEIFKTKSIALFLRTTEGIGVETSTFLEGVGLENRTNDNRLFISVAAQLGGVVSKRIMRFFQKNLNIVSGLDTDGYEMFTKMSLHENLSFIPQMKEFYQRVGLGFESVKVKEELFDPSQLPEDLPNNMRSKLSRELKGKSRLIAMSEHPIFNEKGIVIDHGTFELDEIESAGTIKLFGLSGPIFDTLASGSVLVVDELDAKMHPLISQYVVRLFNSRETNPHGAQLIFNTHDTNLLSKNVLRRDQIWFTEKNPQGETDLYRLMDVVMPNQQPPRNDANLERNYIAGRYGAIPYITY